MTKALRAGTVWVNTYLHLDPGVPFIGYKTSGWGSDLGPEAMDSYAVTKSVWIEASCGTPDDQNRRYHPRCCRGATG